VAYKKRGLSEAEHAVGKWHERMAEPTIADAILDRLIHNAYRIELKGESMRKKQQIKIPEMVKIGKGGGLNKIRITGLDK